MLVSSFYVLQSFKCALYLFWKKPVQIRDKLFLYTDPVNSTFEDPFLQIYHTLSGICPTTYKFFGPSWFIWPKFRRVGNIAGLSRPCGGGLSFSLFLLYQNTGSPRTNGGRMGGLVNQLTGGGGRGSHGHEHWLINYIDTKAKCRHLKKFTFRGTFRQVFICLRPPPILIGFCLGWCSNFAGSESGQIRSDKLLQNIGLQ